MQNLFCFTGLRSLLEAFENRLEVDCVSPEVAMAEALKGQAVCFFFSFLFLVDSSGIQSYLWKDDWISEALKHLRAERG